MMNNESLYGSNGLPDNLATSDADWSTVDRLKAALEESLRQQRHLQQQADRLMAVSAATRQEEENRRQEILKELYQEQVRRQEAEAEACRQRHSASESALKVLALEEELRALTGGLIAPRPEVKQKEQKSQEKKDITTEDTEGIPNDLEQLKTLVSLLRQQIIIHRDDFSRERNEKEKTQRLNQQLKSELDHIGRQLMSTQAKLCDLEAERDILPTDHLQFSDGMKHSPLDLTNRRSHDTVGLDTCLREKLRLHAIPHRNDHHQTNHLKPRPHTFSDEDPRYKPAGDHITEDKRPDQTWSCPQCTLENNSRSDICDACGYKRQTRKHLYRQQSTPMRGWTESDGYTISPYR